MKSYEDRIAKLERELKESLAYQTVDVTCLTEDIRVKEEKAVMREAGAYVNAHGDLLAKLVKRYLEADFSWMVDLVLRGKEESDEEPEREREDERNDNVPGEQVGRDPPIE